MLHLLNVAPNGGGALAANRSSGPVGIGGPGGVLPPPLATRRAWWPPSRCMGVKSPMPGWRRQTPRQKASLLCRRDRKRVAWTWRLRDATQRCMIPTPKPHYLFARIGAAVNARVAGLGPASTSDLSHSRINRPLRGPRCRMIKNPSAPKVDRFPIPCSAPRHCHPS